MSNFIYGDKKDKIVCDEAIKYHLKLIGGVDKIKHEKYLSEFLRRVKTFQTYNKGTVNNYVNSSQEGLTRLDKDGFLHIDVIGNGGQDTKDRNKVLNHVVHECCHAFNHLLYIENAQNIQGIVKEDVYYYPSMGLIGTKDSRTMETVGQGFYGDMYRESMMDLMTNVALVSFNDDFKEHGINADTVISNPNYKRKVDTAMGQFNPLIQLMISAFSNDSNISYTELINNGIGIYDYKVKKNNGKEMRANDFLYGIMCDPFHIEDEFNRVMRNNPSYRMFTELLDAAYKRGVLETNLSEPNKNIIRFAIEQMSIFLNEKCRINVSNGTFTQDEANRLISKYNTIYNEVVKIYGYREQESNTKITHRSNNGNGQQQDVNISENAEYVKTKKEKWYNRIINKIKIILKKKKIQQLPDGKSENRTKNEFLKSIKLNISGLPSYTRKNEMKNRDYKNKENEHSL